MLFFKSRIKIVVTELIESNNFVHKDLEISVEPSATVLSLRDSRSTQFQNKGV